MPSPLLIPGIQAGTELIGQGINAVSQSSMNRKMRAHAWKMYDRQRRDALADWIMQNEYNSPTAQMQRLREAGLNPALVYKNGADNTAGVVRSSDAPAWNPKPPQFDLGGAFSSGLGAYYDTQIKQAQADNLKAQNTVLVQDALLRAAQVLNTTATTEKTKVDTATGQFDLSLKSDLREISMDAARQSVEKMKADTKYTLDENERKAAMQAPNLQKAVEEILMLRAQRVNTVMEREAIEERIHNLRKDEELKHLDIELRKLGIGPNDKLWERVLGRIVNASGVSINMEEIKKDVMSFLIDWGILPGTRSPLQRKFGR